MNGKNISDDCTCPHDWRSTPLDLTAAGNQPRPIQVWTRTLTVKTCPEHGEAKEGKR